MDTPFVRTFDLRHYDLDSRMKLSPRAACRLLQESAACHADSLGIAQEHVLKHGLAWVLNMFHVRFETAVPLERWPGWRDTVVARTWRSGLERFFALRDYELTSHEGELLAVGTSYWSLFDTASRKLASLPAFITETYPREGTRALDNRMGKLGTPSRADYERSFLTLQSDIDFNDHVNNISYVCWALETVPREIAGKMNLAEVEILFRAETTLGEEILSVAEKKVAPDGSVELLHRLSKRNDGREVAQARTRWIG